MQPFEIDRCEFCVRLSKCKLRPVLTGVGIRYRDLVARLLQLSLGGRHIGAGTLDLNQIIARVEFDKQVASRDLAVVVDMKRRDIGRHLRNDRHEMRLDVSIVCLFRIETGQQEVGADP